MKEKRKYDKSPDCGLKKYIKDVWYSGRNCASAIGVSPITIYNNYKNPKGAYKLISSLYEALCVEREISTTLRHSYANLVTQYNELLSCSNNPVKEYLAK